MLTCGYLLIFPFSSVLAVLHAQRVYTLIILLYLDPSHCLLDIAGTISSHTLRTYSIVTESKVV